MRGKWTITAILAAAAAASPAAARPAFPAFLSAGDAADAPEGYARMCRNAAARCVQAALPVVTVDEDRALWRVARRVNARVNRHTRQRSDLATFGVDEEWRASGDGADAAGDCEDLALQKQAELLAAGVPARRLFLATVFRGGGVGLHTVLILRRERGDYVLDSRTGSIKRWRTAGYAWLRLQSPDDPSRWHRAAIA